MQLLPTSDYYKKLFRALPSCKKRVVLAAMMILADNKTSAIFDQLRRALQRGVSVHILLDPFTYSYSSRWEGLTRAQHQALVRRTKQTLQELKNLGATVSLYNKLGLNPFKGRCHVKITVVDDQVFSFGGVNFGEYFFGVHDYMLASKNPSLADELAELVAKIASQAPLHDAELQIDDHHSVLFDAGQPKKSVIYDRARKLAAQSKCVYYVSQMVPSGHLGRAIRQTKNYCYFNRPNQAEGLGRLALTVDRLVSGITNHYRGSTYIHAKFILFELHDGSKALISGSHNFSWRGVVYGTKEIALYSTSQNLWRQLYDFMQQQIVV